MKTIVSLVIGYLMGCISPAAIISKIKKVNLREAGTKNLGATNTTLVLGFKSGLIVLTVDVLKSILSAKLAKLLFPQLIWAGMVACIGCILGHCFPVFLGFQGGKGVAALAGMVLEYNPWFAIPIIIPGTILMLVLNTGVAAPMVGCTVFPVLVAIYGNDIHETILALIAGAIVIVAHWDNLKRAWTGTDVISARGFFGKVFSKN